MNNMTPIEKAIELKHKMYAKILDYNIDYTDSNNIEKLNIFDDNAKECALIAVYEILKTNPYEWDGEDLNSTIDYWEEVKKEIEKL
jgi:hypothetical protein